jgi:hypothetical protein
MTIHATSFTTFFFYFFYEIGPSLWSHLFSQHQNVICEFTTIRFHYAQSKQNLCKYLYFFTKVYFLVSKYRSRQWLLSNHEKLVKVMKMTRVPSVWYWAKKSAQTQNLHENHQFSRVPKVKSYYSNSWNRFPILKFSQHPNGKREKRRRINKGLKTRRRVNKRNWIDKFSWKLHSLAFSLMKITNQRLKS